MIEKNKAQLDFSPTHVGQFQIEFSKLVAIGLSMVLLELITQYSSEILGSVPILKSFFFTNQT